uniref:Epidermal patterning factor-like protein n=1 Tax=Kalanchoe fedtschenkoi TaxID=63787 RepID=A0A7N0ZWX7_KALFE
MKGTRCWFVTVTALLFQIMSSVSATSRSFAPDDHLSPAPASAPAFQPGLGGNQIFTQDQYSTPLDHPISNKDAEDLTYKVRKIGSSPPSCDGKCYGCSPCRAIQVPTITSRVGLQYANYEPEGWKCKCGPSFYSP